MGLARTRNELCTEPYALSLVEDLAVSAADRTKLKRAVFIEGLGDHAMPALRGVTIWLAADPIFDAIEAHQEAWGLAREASDDEIDALMAAEADQLAELLRMTPKTIAGCAAMMRWIETYSRDEANHSHLFYDWDDPWSEPGSTLLGRLAAVIAKEDAG